MKEWTKEDGNLPGPQWFNFGRCSGFGPGRNWQGIIQGILPLSLGLVQAFLGQHPEGRLIATSVFCLAERCPTCLNWTGRFSWLRRYVRTPVSIFNVLFHWDSCSCYWDPFGMWGFSCANALFKYCFEHSGHLPTKELHIAAFYLSLMRNYTPGCSYSFWRCLWFWFLTSRKAS